MKKIIAIALLCIPMLQCQSKHRSGASPKEPVSANVNKRPSDEIAKDIREKSADYQAQACQGTDASTNPICPSVNVLASTDTSTLTTVIDTIASDPTVITDATPYVTTVVGTTTSTGTGTSTGTATNSNTAVSTGTNTNTETATNTWTTQQKVGMTFMVLGAVGVISGSLYMIHLSKNFNLEMRKNAIAAALISSQDNHIFTAISHYDTANSELQKNLTPENIKNAKNTADNVSSEAKRGAEKLREEAEEMKPQSSKEGLKQAEMRQHAAELEAIAKEFDIKVEKLEQLAHLHSDVPMRPGAPTQKTLLKEVNRPVLGTDQKTIEAHADTKEEIQRKGKLTALGTAAAAISIIAGGAIYGTGGTQLAAGTGSDLTGNYLNALGALVNEAMGH